VGLYGVVAFGVVRQTREFGIRIALGARRSEVMKLVLRTAMRTSAVGITIGVVAAAFATPLLGDALYGVQPLDPATFVIVVTTLVLVSLLASWIPARRATRVDPMLALRTE
jgi:putative ABC transport system permease protein